MSVGIIGEEGAQDITLLNGYLISIEYEGGPYFNCTRYHSDHRIIRLYNDKNELVSELVEENPHQGEHETRVKEHLKKLGYPKSDEGSRDSDVIF